MIRPLPLTLALLLAGALAQPACRCGDRPSRRPPIAPATPPEVNSALARRPAGPESARSGERPPPTRPPPRAKVAEPAPAAPPASATIVPADAGAVLAPGLRRRGERLDIDVHKGDIRRLLTQIAAFTGTNIVLFDDVKGSVTVQMRDVPLFMAVATVARAVGCRAEPAGGMILIRCAEKQPAVKPVRGPEFP